jgi:CheY-like chemotaxis protein
MKGRKQGVGGLVGNEGKYMKRHCKILLVEDRDEDALLFRRAVESKSQFKVIAEAKNGDEAIAYLEGTGAYRNREKYPFPDVVILDLKLPSRSGF